LTVIGFVGSAALAERAFLGLYVPSAIVKDDRSSHARLSRMALESRDVAVETPARLEAPEITRTSPPREKENERLFIRRKKTKPKSWIGICQERLKNEPTQFLDNKKMTLIACLHLKNQGEK